MNKKEENKHKMLIALHRLAQDEQLVQLVCTKFESWCLMSAVQLANRHAQVGSNHGMAVAVKLARKFMDELTAHDPDLKLLAEMGWNQTCDVKADQ